MISVQHKRSSRFCFCAWDDHACKVRFCFCAWGDHACKVVFWKVSHMVLWESFQNLHLFCIGGTMCCGKFPKATMTAWPTNVNVFLLLQVGMCIPPRWVDYNSAISVPYSLRTPHQQKKWLKRHTGKGEGQQKYQVDRRNLAGVLERTGGSMLRGWALEFFRICGQWK
jgi:hypothetical protein